MDKDKTEAAWTPATKSFGNQGRPVKTEMAWYSEAL